jgi:hypothetical protein
MLRRYRCLHSKGFFVLALGVVVGEESLTCGLLRLSPGMGSKSPWLLDFDTGQKVCRVRIPEEDQNLGSDLIFRSSRDDLYLELFQE